MTTYNIDEIRQSPRSFVDLETVEWLADRAMVLEQQLAEKDKLLLLAKDALEKIREVTGSNTFAHNYADEALAAINDSKLVAGLILCDAEQVASCDTQGRLKINPNLEVCPSWINVGTELYAPRRTEK